jgi:hypothetical protein
MNEQKKRRLFTTDVKSIWPKKVRFTDIHLQKIGNKQPKFEVWQQKLINQLNHKTHCYL